MQLLINKLLDKIRRFFLVNKDKPLNSKELIYDFNKSNPLGGNGERVDIQISKGAAVKFETLDLYQKNHFRRYEFAQDYIHNNVICGDFACGTGYGSVMLSTKAEKVIGADINQAVIDIVRLRYADIKNVEFLNLNLLDLNFDSKFDFIISFETIEHFSETNIPLLLKIFHTALKSNGQLIFSVPYMQERSEAALQLGHHLSFYLDEKKLGEFLETAGFTIELFKYQNYSTHSIEEYLEKKEIIICVARKRTKYD